MKLLSRKLFLFFMFLLAMNLVQAQTILKQNGKFGLSDEDGTVVLEPKYDTIEPSYFVGTTHNRERQIVLYKIPAEAPLFFVKQNGKFAYAYKMSIDSTKRMKPELIHWYVSEFEFDSLAITSVGSSYYYNNYGFTTMIYKKNGKWGMIYIQTHAGSGGGMFPSAGFYADVMGKQYRTEAKYDTIFRSQLDFFHPTFLNGKYGLINPVRGEDYAPEFDTIPVYFEDRKRYVKKNGKWGVIEMIQQTRTIKYSVDCRCNKIKKFRDDFYACIGLGDTISFFDAALDSEHLLYDNNRPLVFNDSQSLYIETFGYTWPRTKTIVAVRSTYQASYHVYDEVYIYNLQTRILSSYHEAGYKYMLALQAPENGLIVRFKPDSSSRIIKYEFFNIETHELQFALDLDSSSTWGQEEYVPKKGGESQAYIHRFYSQDKYWNERTVGYFDYRTQTFSKRKPKRRQLRY